MSQRVRALSVIKPIPPRNLSLHFPLGEALRKAMAQPTDSADPAAYQSRAGAPQAAA